MFAARKNIVKKIALGVVAAAFPALGRITSASTLTWDFSSPTGDVGSSSHTYMDTTSTASITAHGYATQNGVVGASLGNTWDGPGSTFLTGTVTGTDLYGKVTAGNPSETGLGLASLNSDHEIQNKSFIQLDVTGLEASHFTNLTFTISSIQTGEGFYIWGSNTLASPGTLLDTGTNPPGGAVQTVTDARFLSGAYKYISISATYSSSGSDVLLMDGLSAQPAGGPTPTPLPASVWSGIVLVGGLAGARGLAARRRRNQHLA